MAKRNFAKPTSTVPVRQTEDGLHLANSILWFDSQVNGDLSFLSSAMQNFHSKVPQVIATEETIKILEAHRKKLNALTCQYNRPFSIGRLKMELLPSGCVLGGASLYVETDQGRLLYAPQLQPHRIPTVRQMQLKKATTLVLGVANPDPHAALPNRKKEKERLLEVVSSCVERGEYPVILCDPVALAQELTKLFSDAELPVAVHETIFKVNQVYEACGSKLGNYTRFSAKRAKQKITLFPLLGKRTMLLRAALPEGPVYCVEGTSEISALPTCFNVQDRFTLASACDGPEIREIITAVSPKELFIFGPYAKRYVDELSGVCPVVQPLFVNDQPTLF